MPELRIDYAPNPGQAQFHADRWDVRFRGLFPGTGGGKTLGAGFEVLNCALPEPDTLWLVGEPNFPMVRRIMYPTFEQLLGRPHDQWEKVPIVRKWHSTDHMLELRNRAKIWFIGLEDPRKAEGPNVDGLWLDEIWLYRDWATTWRILRRRLRGSRPGTTLRAIVSTHSPTEEMVADFEGPNRLESARAYRWSTLDAVRWGTLPESYGRDMVRAHPGAADYKRVILGLPALAEGAVYDNWDPTRHVAAAPRPNVVDRMTYGVDWGWSMPACLLAVAWQGNVTHVVRELYGPRISREDILEAYRNWTGTGDEPLRPPWPEGIVWCGHERLQDIEFLRRNGVDARATPAGRGSVKSGVTHINSKLRGLEHFVDPSCVNAIRERKNYAWKPGGRDEPEAGNDHAMDAERYAVMGGDRVVQRQGVW